MAGGSLSTQTDFIYGCLATVCLRKPITMMTVLFTAVSPEDLISAVRTVTDGNALPAPSVTRLIIEEFTQRPLPSGSSPELEKLTMFSLTNAPIQLAPKLTPFAPNGMVIKALQLFPQHYLKAYK